MQLPISGGCLCKAVRYQIKHQPMAIINCYCRQCQYVSGTSHSSVIATSVNDIEITGQVKFFAVTADSGNQVERGFCSECGTPLFSRSQQSIDFLGVKIASLDDTQSAAPQCDIWTGSAPQWAQLADHTQKFEQGFS